MEFHITLQEAKKQGLKVEGYTLKRFEETQKELYIFQPLCELIPMVRISKYDGETYLEDVFVLLKYRGVLLKPYKAFNEKTYQFSLFNDTFFANFKSDLIAPNKVGKPTAKKLDEWLDYLSKNEEQKIKILEERSAKETDFLNKLKNSGLSINYQSSDNKRGYIYHKNFKYSFEIENGYINQRLIYRGEQNIEALLNL